MPLDPATLCARTATGDAELAAPRHGLAIAQRRLLSFLDQPLGIDELVRRPGVIPERLERDLSRLVENGLVEIHRPAVPTAPTARSSPARAAPDARALPAGPASRRGFPSKAGDSTSVSSGAGGAGTAVVIGRKVRRARALAVPVFSPWPPRWPLSGCSRPRKRQMKWFSRLSLPAAKKVWGRSATRTP